MSIKLEVKEYCADCPEFEPKVRKHDFGATLGLLTEVSCTHARRCEEIYILIKSNFKEEIEDEHN